MLFGCCTNMLPRDPGTVGEAYLDTLAGLGYDYVELPLGDLTTVLSPEKRRALRSVLQNTLPVRACNNFFPEGIHVCGPDATPLEQTMEYVQRAMEIAADLGATITVFGSPWAKICPERFPKTEAFRQLADLCGHLGDAAAPYGITVALEPNNRLETNMINTYGDVLDLIRAASHPRIRGLQDYFHLKQERDTVESLLAGGEYLVHTHFACYAERRFPRTGSEDPYYEVYFRALREIGYAGGISVEAFLRQKEDFQRDAAAAIGFLREMTQ